MPPHEHTRFEAHLAICTGCTAHVKQMRQTIGLLGTLTEATMTPEARDDLLDVFRRWKQA